MPKAVAVYLVSNGNYWRAEWRDASGKQTRSIGSKTKYSRTKAAAICRELGNQLAGRRVAAGATPRLSEWVSHYVDSRSDVSDGTLGSYRDCGLYLAAHFENDPPISDITRAQAGDWMAAMASGILTRRLEAARNPSKKTTPFHKPSLFTIRRHVRTAKQLFQAAVEEDRIPSNPFLKLNGAVPKTNREWKQVTPEDMTKILAACPDDEWRRLFALCRYAGLRRGEALDLRWSDIDLARNRMLVNARTETNTTKRRKRMVPIEPAKHPTGLLAMLQTAERGDSEGPCSGISANNVRRKALLYIGKAGLARYAKPFHTLRKCCQTDWAMVYPINVVTEWLGNSIDVAMLHYLRVPEEMYQRPEIVDRL